MSPLLPPRCDPPTRSGSISVPLCSGDPFDDKLAAFALVKSSLIHKKGVPYNSAPSILANISSSPEVIVGPVRSQSGCSSPYPRTSGPVDLANARE
jgi:hypothetical protein